MWNEMSGPIAALRQAGTVQRHALAALAAGAQLVLRYGKWEGYAEERGRLRPLGLTIEDAPLKAVLSMLPPDTTQAVTASDPLFVYMPARRRELVLELLTLSMPTQTLMQGFGDDEGTQRRRERQAA